jgi:hypothetical protein
VKFQAKKGLKIVILSAHGFMRVFRPFWLERLDWREGWEMAQGDNWCG